jgi:hypothetical protein
VHNLEAQKQGTWPKPAFSPVSFDYLVVAGGGSGGPGGGSGGGGGGAGGYRTSFPGGTKITLSGFVGDSFPITVGAGGAQDAPISGRAGSPSIFSTITSTGGGGGGTFSAGGNGGSGGGGGGGYGPCQTPDAGGTGNSPPVSPPQGNPGGISNPVPSSVSNLEMVEVVEEQVVQEQMVLLGLNLDLVVQQVLEEVGSPNSISGSAVFYAGGGGGAKGSGGPAQPQGGNGGGGNGSVGQPVQGESPSANGTAGAVNTGGGGGGIIQDSSGYNPGSIIQVESGIIIVRAPGSANISASPGTNTITTLPAPAGGCKVATFTVSGTLTVS